MPETWPGYAAWRAKLDQELERFRSLPRAPGQSFLDRDGRLDQDKLELYYECQDIPWPGERTREDEPKARV